MDEKEPVVFVVDDSGSVRKSLERLFRSAELKVECFESAQDFLNAKRHNGPSCIVLDVRMPGLSGFDLQDALGTSGFIIPIIFLTGHGNVPQSVRAMKAGAVDFIEKPFEGEQLLDAVQKALEKDRLHRALENDIRQIMARVQSLTPREYQVFTHVIKGRLNKQIAFDLGTVEKTIKVHRAQVMRKMQVDSLAALVRMAEKAGLAGD
ncbi:MAG: response regulator transcription factor [Syntrophobacteraceae bacterium]|nr:response regulator transcription factor [Syntrophobacteraceae bacterium]